MMVDLAQTFSVKTVAEMVDSRADADLLRRLGVDYLQGYMFGIPSAAPAWQRHAS
jgi:EAL domain-containing protein (putative c-di-GMP-specific phosphodiesterase class I)